MKLSVSNKNPAISAVRELNNFKKLISYKLLDGMRDPLTLRCLQLYLLIH